jgi:hypothetical protein
MNGLKDKKESGYFLQARFQIESSIDINIAS